MLSSLFIIVATFVLIFLLANIFTHMSQNDKEMFRRYHEAKSREMDDLEKRIEKMVMDAIANRGPKL